MKEVDLNVILDLIYNMQLEFSNELDYDYESNFKKDLTYQDLAMLEEVIDRFCSKLENTIKGYLLEREG